MPEERTKTNVFMTKKAPPLLVPCPRVKTWTAGMELSKKKNDRLQKKTARITGRFIIF
jgi:hypothetical protein